MSQELANEQNEQSELERTQPSAPPPRSLDWRPPEYQAQEPEESPPVRRVPPPNRRRRRPPTEGAPAWVVGLGVGALLAVILLLAVAFVLSRPPAEPEPTATIVVMTPTETLVPRATFTPVPVATATPEGQPEATTAGEAPASPGVAPDTIAIGGYARVAAPAGLSLRETADTNGVRIELLETGTVLSVIGGPQQSGGFTWWQLRKLDDGTEGWSAAGSGEDVFLEPAPAP